MGRMTWHLASLQGLESVGLDRDYGTGVPRRTRRAGWSHRKFGIPWRPRLMTPALGRTNLALSLLG